MAEKSVELPEECWELIIQLVDADDDDYPSSHFLNSLSLVCKQFLSITNRLLFTLKLSQSHPPVQSLLPRLLQRFRFLQHIDLTAHKSNSNSILHQISLSGLHHLESLNISHQPNFPAAGLKALGGSNLKSLCCSNTRCFRDSDLNLIADLFPTLEELDISYPDHGNNSKSPVSDSGIFSMSLKLKRLKKINLSGNSFITDNSLAFLSTNCLLLCQLVIHFCDFVSLNGITKLIRECRGRLDYVSVRGIGNPFLSVALKVRFISLSAVDVSDCVVSDEFLYNVADACLPIKKLILARCTNYSFNAISYLLHEYQSLEYLDLEAAYFLADKDVAELSRFLHSVNYINLSGCDRLTSITFYTLLSNCFVLDKMEMAETNIGDENIENNVMANRGIKSLNLARNSSIGSDFLRSVASICPNLEMLNLSNCGGITEGGIVEVLKRCFEITHLEVRGSRVTKNVFIRLDFELPKLKVLSLNFAGIGDDALAMIGKRCCRLLKLDLTGNSSLTLKGVKEVVENCKDLMEINLRWCDNVSVDIVPWMVFSRPSLKKIVAPGGFILTESQRNLFLRHGCLVCES